MSSLTRPLLLLILSLLVISVSNAGAQGCPGCSTTGIETWITDPAAGILFVRNDKELSFNKIHPGGLKIEIDSSLVYQSMEGFGNCLTGGSASLINRMGREARTKLLTELFSPSGNGIGISCLRISIGSSDLDDHVYSCDDIPAGKTDPELRHFGIGTEKKDLVPVLKEILRINPGISILASPWSAPAWMKTNGSSKGGSLKKEWFGVYAQYFVKYIKAMKDEGISIGAVTVQNEPLHPGNNPSMYMTAEDQALFVGSWLGPAFEKEGIKTRIIVYDHNANRPDYPLTIYRNPLAYRYVDGAAFHLYEGPIDTLSMVHDAFPEKNLYFTEQWVGAPGDLAEDLRWHVKTLVIGASRNWCRSVLEWNTASDPQYEPHTEGGCTECLGTVTIYGDRVTRNPAWYILAHSARFVRPGAMRLGSSEPAQLPNVAFRNPDGSYVLIVVNDSENTAEFNIVFNGIAAVATLAGGAVSTYTWR